MCEICMSYPCNPRCPNADEPKEVYTCSECREPIYEGDKYYNIGNAYYHEECITVDILLEELGETVQEA